MSAACSGGTCSQMRTTRQPSLSRDLRFAVSLAWFLASLNGQYPEFAFGIRP